MAPWYLHVGAATGALAGGAGGQRVLRQHGRQAHEQAALILITQGELTVAAVDQQSHVDTGRRLGQGLRDCRDAGMSSAGASDTSTGSQRSSSSGSTVNRSTVR